MAIHPDTASLLKESLPEFVEAARYCVTFTKNFGWGSNPGGCLGYPAAALMFSVADSIGSYSSELCVVVDGQSIKIDKKHFRVFNSDYYSLSLPSPVIDKLYANYRNTLIHNAALVKDHFLFIDNSSAIPFLKHSGKVHVNVSAFLTATQLAVKKFLQQADSVVPGSRAERNINLKK